MSSMILVNDKPLLVSKQIAIKLGVEKSMIIQQLHYWIEKNKEQNVNFFEGKHWMFSTVQEIQERDFPFYSIKTLRRHLNALTESGIILRKQFSSENTYHYTIDYDKLAVICGEQLAKKEEKTAISDECAHGQNDQHEVVKMTTAILKENNKENNYIYNNSSSHKFSLLQKNKTFRRSEEEGLSAKIPNYTEVKDFIQKYQQENPNLNFLDADQFYSMCKLCNWKFNNTPIRNWKHYYIGIINKMNLNNNIYSKEKRSSYIMIQNNNPKAVEAVKENTI